MQHDSAADTWDPTSTPSFWINRASRALLRLQNERLRPFGVGMSQIPVLHALKDGASLSQKELADRSSVEQPTMTELLVRMEREGVIERRPNPKDGRGSLVSLAPQSRLRPSESRAALVQAQHEAMAGFSEEEKAMLVSLLQRVVNNIEP